MSVDQASASTFSFRLVISSGPRPSRIQRSRSACSTSSGRGSTLNGELSQMSSATAISTAMMMRIAFGETARFGKNAARVCCMGLSRVPRFGFRSPTFSASLPSAPATTVFGAAFSAGLSAVVCPPDLSVDSLITPLVLFHAPERDYQPARHDQRASHQRRRLDVLMIDDVRQELGDEKENGDVDTEHSAERPARRVHREAIAEENEGAQRERKRPPALHAPADQRVPADLQQRRQNQDRQPRRRFAHGCYWVV